MTAERKRYWRPGISLDLDTVEPVRNSAARAILIGVLVGAAMLLMQISIDRIWGHAEQTFLYSDVFMGIVTAFVVGFAMRHRQAHLRHEQARLRMVAEMNHHVRNALTAISLTVYAKNDPQLEKITRESIQRIDWALREVLANPQSAPPPPPRETSVSGVRSRNIA